MADKAGVFNGGMPDETKRIEILEPRGSVTGSVVERFIRDHEHPAGQRERWLEKGQEAGRHEPLRRLGRLATAQPGGAGSGLCKHPWKTSGRNDKSDEIMEC